MEKNEPNHSIKSFDVSTSHWKWRSVQQPSTSPAPRHLHSLVHHNNYLYLFGGFGDGEKYLDDLWQYSFAKRRWKKIKSKIFPTARHSHQAVVYQGRMILFGGISEGKTMNDLWTFDFATESWKLEERTLHSVWGHSMVVYAGKLIVFGGADEKVKVTNNLVVLDASTFEVMDINITNDVPSARQYASMVFVGDSIYLFGGFNNKSLQDFYQITISPDNQIITKSLEVPSFVENLRGASLSLLPYQSQLILFGGRTNKHLSDGTYSFSLGSSKWSTCPSVGPSPRYYHKACEVNGRLILYGGLGMKEGSDKAVNLNDMWIYSDGTIDALAVQENLEIDPSSIPAEIWSHILSYLNEGKDVASTSVVSKQFFNIIRANERLQSKLKSYILTRHMWMPPLTDVIKIVVGGMAGSGKSATVIQFVQNHFIYEYDPTIENSFRKRFIVDGQEHMLDILDTAGPEEYSAFLDHYYRGSHGVFMVYSVTNRESLKDLDHYLACASRAKEGSKFPLIIVGNKDDLESERQVTQAEGQEYAKKHSAIWMETRSFSLTYGISSAKTRHNIEEAFDTLVRIILTVDKARKENPASTITRPQKKDRCLMM